MIAGLAFRACKCKNLQVENIELQGRKQKDVDVSQLWAEQLRWNLASASQCLLDVSNRHRNSTSNSHLHRNGNSNNNTKNSNYITSMTSSNCVV